MMIGAVVFGMLAAVALVGITLLMYRTVDADVAGSDTPEYVSSDRVRRMQGE